MIHSISIYIVARGQEKTERALKVWEDQYNNAVRGRRVKKHFSAFFLCSDKLRSVRD